ncbi:MAG: hypothetical protein WEB87_07245 [Bacteriovoracaceae bacterium]
MHKNLNTSVFQKELEKFSGRSFKSDFDRYVLKKDSAWEEREKRKTSAAPNPFHPKLSKKQLMDLL